MQNKARKERLIFYGYMKVGVHTGSRKSPVRIGVVLFTLTAFTLLYLVTNDQLPSLSSLPSLTRGASSGKYLVNGAHCKMADRDAFDQSILEYLAPTTTVECSAMPPLSKIIVNNTQHVLLIDQHAAGRYKILRKHRIDCCYSTVTRVTQSRQHFNEEADKKYKVDNCEKIGERKILKNITEFIYVKCQSVPKKAKSGKVVYENMHAMVPKKYPSTTLPQMPKDTEATKKLNVLIVGIDSVSRLSLRRTMPSVLTYLNANGWMEMDGYNKIADNTLPNLMAILAGRSMDQLHKECLNGTSMYMDDCPSLWKDFKANGFLTAYAEDVPSLSTFNYRMTGFVEPPTDYYLRPFMLASHALLPVHNKDGLPICIGPQSAADLIFDYARDFASTFKKSHNFFGLFWLNSFSHNDVNAPAELDLRLLKLLKQLEEIGTYNNTVVLVLSDHGIRFGKIRNSFQGFLEERLPFIFFHFPSWYLGKYPEAQRNLQKNRNRLTSPYDVYATLSLLLGTPVIPTSCPKCTSLTNEISEDRSCADAGIDPHWCTCPSFHPLSPLHPVSQKTAHYFMEIIKNKTRDLLVKERAPNAACAQRTLDGIVRIHEADTKDLVIVIQTQPFGLFEATIGIEHVHNDLKLKVLGFISRLDSYFSTSKCVHSKLLQFYCHCE